MTEILVGLDDRPAAQDALALARLLAYEEAGAQ
jgi:hypothetical protein